MVFRGIIDKRRLLTVTQCLSRNMRDCRPRLHPPLNSRIASFKHLHFRICLKMLQGVVSIIVVVLMETFLTN